MSINTVERALILLKQMAFSPDGTGVREMARNLGISPSVVQKSLRALTIQEFAEQDPETQLYHLGPMAIRVGLAGLAKLEIRQVAHPVLQELADRSGETALLGVPQYDEAIYIDKVLSAAEIRLDVPIGSRRPLNCTAVGKALLAYMPDEEIERLYQAGVFVQPTPNSKINLDDLKREMATIRQTGVAPDREEYAIGTMCFASPVRNYEGKIIASLVVSGPTQRMKTTQDDVAQLVIECADKISAAMGYSAEIAQALS